MVRKNNTRYTRPHKSLAHCLSAVGKYTISKFDVRTQTQNILERINPLTLSMFSLICITENYFVKNASKNCSLYTFKFSFASMNDLSIQYSRARSPTTRTKNTLIESLFSPMVHTLCFTAIALAIVQ